MTVWRSCLCAVTSSWVIGLLCTSRNGHWASPLRVQPELGQWLQSWCLEERAASHLPTQSRSEVLQSRPQFPPPPQHLECAQCHWIPPPRSDWPYLPTRRGRIFTSRLFVHTVPSSPTLRETNGKAPRITQGAGFFYFSFFFFFCYCRGPARRPEGCLSVRGCGLTSTVFMIWNRRAWIHHGYVCMQGTVPWWYWSVQQHQFPRAHQATSVHLPGGHCSDQSDCRSPPAAQSSAQGTQSAFFFFKSSLLLFSSLHGLYRFKGESKKI